MTVSPVLDSEKHPSQNKQEPPDRGHKADFLKIEGSKRIGRQAIDGKGKEDDSRYNGIAYPFFLRNRYRFHVSQKQQQQGVVHLIGDAGLPSPDRGRLYQSF